VVCILLGDLFMTTLLTAISDQWGRRRTLLLASVLKIVAGVVFAFQRSFAGLLVAGFVGIITPTGGEVGPFLVIEQNCLTEAVARPEDITKVFGWSVAGMNE
jgi:predicted MFS family arabinose efflux permease